MTDNGEQPIEGAALFVCGTTDGAWTALGNALWAARRPPHVAGGVLVDGWQHLEQLADSNSQARFLLFVDRPDRFLGRRLTARDDGADDALARWCDAARKLLRFAHTRPQSCLLVDTVEAFEHPHALMRLLQDWESGWQETSLPAPECPESRGVEYTLAWSFVRSNDTCTRLYEELNASCAVLPGTVPGPDPLSFDSSAAMDGLRATWVEPVRNEADRKAFAALREDHDELLVRLHRVQEEVEHLYFAGTPQPADPFSIGGSTILQPRSAAVTHSVDTGAHRHAHFEVAEADIAGHQVTRLTFRLLCHRGRPGLLVFAAQQGEQALSSWEPDGEESGRPFMSLVPGDPRDQVRLQQMGTSDWQAVLALAELARRLTKTEGAALSGQWSYVASQLEIQLAGLPPRLRYDALYAEERNRDGQAGLAVGFRNTIFGHRALGDLTLWWQGVGTAGESLHLLLAERAEHVALSQWPFTNDGAPEQAYRIAVGRALGWPSRRSVWRALAPSDCDVVLAVLDALPAVAAVVPESAMATRLSRETLRQTARAYKQEARRAVAWRRAESIVRHALARGRRQG